MIRIPPPIWMFLLLAIAGTVSWAYPQMQIVQWVAPGIVLVVAGLGLSLWAFGLFRSEGTEVNPTSQTNKKLVTRGPYRFTRNPMYLSLVIFSLGVALIVGTLAMFAVPPIVFAIANWVHIPFEEAKMRRQFGTAFDDYTKVIPRWV